MDVSENSGTPKWMVKTMENPIKMDDLGVPPFKETPIWPQVPQVMYFWTSGVFAMTHFGLTTPKMFPRSLGSSTLCFQGVWGAGGSTFWSWDICFFYSLWEIYFMLFPNYTGFLSSFFAGCVAYSFAWFENELVELPVCIQDVLFTWDTAILPWRFKRWCSMKANTREGSNYMIHQTQHPFFQQKNKSQVPVACLLMSFSKKLG